MQQQRDRGNGFTLDAAQEAARECRRILWACEEGDWEFRKRMSRARRLSSGSYSRRIRVGKSEWETGGRPAHRAEPASSMPMTCDSTGSASWRSGCAGAGRSNSIERSPAGRAASRDGRSWPAFSVFFCHRLRRTYLSGRPVRRGWPRPPLSQLYVVTASFGYEDVLKTYLVSDSDRLGGFHPDCTKNRAISAIQPHSDICNRIAIWSNWF